MPTYRSGSTARLALGKEAAYNTASAAMHDIPKSSFTVPGPYELIENDELRSDPNPVANSKGLQSGSGWSFETMVTSDLFGLFCYWFFGGVSVTGTGTPNYVHTFIPSTTNPPSLSAEYGDMQTAIDRFDKYYGLYLNSMGLNVSKTSELMKCSLGGESSGKFDMNAAAALDATPDTYGDARHAMPAATIEIDGSAVAYLTSIDLTIDRTVYPLNPLDGTLYAAAATLGKYSVSCTVMGWRDQADVLYGLDDDAEHTVKLVSPRPGSADHNVEIYFPECYLYATEQFSISDDGPAEFGLQVSPFYDNAAAGGAIEITVQSDIADYSAI